MVGTTIREAEFTISIALIPMTVLPDPVGKTTQPLLPALSQLLRALNNWDKAGKRGCVVLPTGSGKTVIGIKAIEMVNSASLIVVPTIDLMDQWTSVLSKYFTNVKIGNLGGGSEFVQ